jgi:hypothetical protein
VPAPAASSASCALRQPHCARRGPSPHEHAGPSAAPNRAQQTSTLGKTQQRDAPLPAFSDEQFDQRGQRPHCARGKRASPSGPPAHACQPGGLSTRIAASASHTGCSLKILTRPGYTNASTGPIDRYATVAWPGPQPPPHRHDEVSELDRLLTPTPMPQPGARGPWRAGPLAGGEAVDRHNDRGRPPPLRRSGGGAEEVVRFGYPAPSR